MPWFPDSESGAFADVVEDHVAIGDQVKRFGGTSKYRSGRVTGFCPNGEVRVDVGGGQGRIWPRDQTRVYYGTTESIPAQTSEPTQPSPTIEATEIEVVSHVTWTPEGAAKRPRWRKVGRAGVVEKFFYWNDSPTTVRVNFPHDFDICFIYDLKLVR